MDVIKYESEKEPELKIKSNEIIYTGKNIAVKNQEDAENATAFVKHVKAIYTKFETERKKIVKPFNDGVKAINTRFKESTVPLKEVEVSIKRKLLSYQQKIKEENERKLQASIDEMRENAVELADEEFKKGNITRANQLLETAELNSSVIVQTEAVRSEYGAVSSVRKTLAFEIIDIEQLAKHHPHLVLPNEVEIRKMLKNGNKAIHGIRVFEKETITIR